VIESSALHGFLDRVLQTGDELLLGHYA
jgi:hypothetical protein